MSFKKLGYGFADNLGFGRKKLPKFFETEKEDWLVKGRRRLIFLDFLLGAVFLLLLVRLIDLQILKGDYHRQLSEGNRVRQETLPAPRGIIYDRYGQALVRNVPGYKIRNPAFAPPSGATAGRQESGLTPRLGSRGIGNQEYQRISREEALEIEAKGGSEAASLEIGILREYLYPEELAHVLGYLGQRETPELDYKLGDLIGRSGLEEKYEKNLRGKEGGKLWEVDSQGQKVRTLGEIAPESGQNLTLTLDLNLQKVAYQALGETQGAYSQAASDGRGAVVAQNPKTGEILVLVSRPSFNPNLFTSLPQEKEIQKILTDEINRPLFNRAISGLYPPGSTFKIITAAAALETGKINAKTQIEDLGEIVIGPYRFPNWYFIQYGKKEVILDIVGALKRSNDIFFYKTAEWVGEKVLGEWAKKFGLGQILGIDLPAESPGFIPTPGWKEKRIGEPWFLGDTYHLGIGQGYILTTPLQVNAWTAVIANGGTLYQPYLVKSPAFVQPSGDSAGKQNFLKKETGELIREGMRQACAPGGTGWPLFNFKVKNSRLAGDEGFVEIPVACKTGTAEYGDPQGKTHAWFSVFAPVGDPEIVVTVLVEGGGEGANVAAPVAKKVLEEYFQNQRAR